jgi:hypothetical protein
MIVRSSRTLFVYLGLFALSHAFCQDAPRDFHFGPSGQATVALTEQSIIEVTLNGKGPFKLFFDTGAGVNILNPEVIAQLNLPPSERVEQLHGISGGKIDTKAFHVDEVRIGDLALSGQDFFSVPIPLPKAYSIVGAIGYELFSRLLIKADYEHHQLTFFDPARFPSTGSGQKLDLLPDPQQLVVQGRVGKATGNFVLDTGALGDVGISINGWFSHQSGLLHRFIRNYHGVFSFGADGKAPPATVERIRSVCLGQACIPGVIGEFSDSTEASPYAGRIGVDLLHRLTTTIDWQHHAIYVEKSSQGDERTLYNPTGLNTDSADTGTDLVVTQVYPRSPASKAHLKVGDRILLVDGHPPAPDLASDDPAFLKPAGTRVILTVQRGNSTWQVPLVLKDIL